MKRTASANANSRSSSGGARNARGRARFVLCIDNSGYPASLEFGKVYRELAAGEDVPKDWLRILDESGEDYCYPAKRFVPIEVPARGRRALTFAK